MDRPDDRKMYEREFKIQEQLQHPRLLGLQAAFVEDTCVYAQFPFIAGGNMRQWIVGEPRPTAAQIQRVCFEVAVGLSHLHSKSVVHCDLKQENVLIDDTLMPLICDFETAKDVINVTVSSVSGAGGTVGYLAPELVGGVGKGTTASDMYAFGVLWLNALYPDGVSQAVRTQNQITMDQTTYPKGPRFMSMIARWKAPSRLHSKDQHTLLTSLLNPQAAQRPQSLQLITSAMRIRYNCVRRHLTAACRVDAHGCRQLQARAS